jgi:N-acylneuraminate cytidylyltransferase
MLNQQRILAIIPARAGSKGIPQKNIRPFCGKPLIAWTIEAALQSKYLDHVILSSESPDIMNIAKSYGCDVPFQRPPHLAEDSTPGIAPILHAIEQTPGYDYVMVLQPTSPLRRAEDIDHCIERTLLKDASACVSVNEPQQNPFWMYTKEQNCTLHPLLASESYTCRQQLPKAYALNGALYLAKTSWLIHNKTFMSPETISFEMPIERSIDIDSLFDFFMAEHVFREWQPCASLATEQVTTI